MASTIKIKRSASAGNAPNNTNIDTAELALNTADRIMYSSDGTDVFEIGANLTSLAVSGQVTLANIISANGSIGTAGQALLTDGSSKVYWGSGSSGSAAVRTDYIYTANEGQTTFSGLDDDGDTLSLGSTFDVFLNGSLISPSGNYTSNSTAIVFTDSTGNNDIITVRNIETVAGELRNTYVYTANEGQTVFTGSDDNSATLSMTNYKDVFINGVLITDTTDNFTANDTHITFTGGVSNNDIVTIKSYDTVAEFSSIDDNGSSTAITIDSAGNVGIGVTPSRFFHIQKTGVDDQQIALIGGGSGSGGASLRIGAVGTSVNIDAVNNGVGAFTPLNINGTQIYFGEEGTAQFALDSGVLYAVNAAGPALLNEAATSTNPTLVPNKADLDTGVGWVSANIGALVAGGTEVLRWDSSGVNGVIGATTAAAGTFTSLTANLGAAATTGLTLLTTGAFNAIDFTNGTRNYSMYVGVNTGDFGIYDRTGAGYRILINPDGTINAGGNVLATNAAGPAMLNEAASSTNPTLVPNRADTDTGIGSSAADELSVIAGGTEVGRWFNSGLLMYGQLRVPDGTFGSGGLVFYNDLDTGIYRPAADSIAFATGGSEKMRIDSSGNVGIGASASRRLHVSTNVANVARFQATGGVSNVIELMNTGSSPSHPFIGSNAQSVVMGASGASDLTIDSNGRVGIGTTSPSYTLEVAGTSRNTTAVAGGISHFVETTDTGAGSFTQLGVSTNAGGLIMQLGTTAGGPTGYIYSAVAGGINMYTSAATNLVLGVNNNTYTYTLDAATGAWSANNATGPALMNEAASATNPTIIPNRAATTSGFGANGTGNTIYGIGSGAEHFRFGNGAMHISVGLTVAASIAGQNAVNRFGSSSGDADIRVLAGNAATSRVYFGDSDSETAGALAYYHFLDLFEFGQTVQLNNAAGPVLLNETASSTNPTLVPNKADPDTGVGWNSTNIGSLIAGGTEVASFATAAFNITGAANVKQANNGTSGGLVLTRSDSAVYSSVYTGGDDKTYLQNNNGRYIALSATTGDTGGAGSAGAGNQYVELQINGSRYKLLHDGTI